MNAVNRTRADRPPAAVAARPLVWYVAQGYAVCGGHEAHLLHFATAMRKYGFATRVLVLDDLPREPHRFMRLLRERGIPLDSVRASRGPAASALFAAALAPWWLLSRLRGRRTPAYALRAYLANRLAARALRRRLRRERPDLVHVMGRLAVHAWAALPAARTILHHGTEGRRDDTWDTAELEAFQAFAERAARNFAPGSGVAENLRREFGITRPIELVFTICPDDTGGASESTGGRSVAGGRPLRFGLLCRLTPEKGIGVLLESLRIYAGRHGTLDFTLAGQGPLDREIRDYIRRHGLQGLQLQPEFNAAADVLRGIDVFVHPSLSDAMPMAVAEALMCGLPCVVTRVGGLPDLVRDGVEGLLINPGRTDDLVAAMERFQAMSPVDLDHYRQRARARYESVCHPDRVGAQLADHYRAMIKTGDPYE